ncbi:galactose oxidase early set domain-containing protein [Streptomyces sp. E-08]|uniref:galactose oxidase early set domain-containing protein n=1 Tax=Streptomyces sp. E-08 TaxID=3404047 RepID=UPI003CF24150
MDLRPRPRGDAVAADGRAQRASPLPLVPTPPAERQGHGSGRRERGRLHVERGEHHRGVQPPYLFNPDGTLATRPAIVSFDGKPLGDPAIGPTGHYGVHHGHNFVIGTPQADEVAKVVLVRPWAVTHQTDTEQRVPECDFVRTGDQEVTATAPDGGHSHAIAPRGYYMLFVLNGSGTPSMGRFVHLHQPDVGHPRPCGRGCPGLQSSVSSRSGIRRCSGWSAR